jgi:hypothetical protein
VLHENPIGLSSAADPHLRDPTAGLLDDRNRPGEGQANDPEICFAHQHVIDNDDNVNPGFIGLGWTACRFVDTTRDYNEWTQDDLTARRHEHDDRRLGLEPQWRNRWAVVWRPIDGRTGSGRGR